MPRSVPVNDKGYRIGEGHHSCKIPDEIVTQLRDLHERDNQPVNCGELARRFNIKLETVRAIVYYRRRAQTPKAWRLIDGE